MRRAEAEAALQPYGVSRETLDRLLVFEAELDRWRRRINLVGPSAFAELWTRHIADTLQLATLAEGRSWIDLGSGAGFPGLVLAAARPERAQTLVESDGRKCAFLRHAAQTMGLGARVVEARIEAFASAAPPGPHIVTARALAPLPRLLAYAEPLLREGGAALLPKGREHGRELTDARESWTFAVEPIASRTDADGRILRITNIGRRAPEPT